MILQEIITHIERPPAECQLDGLFIGYDNVTFSEVYW